MTSRDKRVMGVGLLVVLAILGWIYVASPMQQRWRDAREALRTGEDELESLQRVAGEGEFYAEERERIAAMVRETENLEASPTIVPALINEVQGIGQERGIQVTRYGPLPPKVEESYAVYSLSLNFQASLSNLVGFVQDLQQAQPVINIRRMHLTPPGADTETGDLSVELLLSVYAIEKPPEGEEAEDAEMAALAAEAASG